MVKVIAKKKCKAWIGIIVYVCCEGENGIAGATKHSGLGAGRCCMKEDFNWRFALHNRDGKPIG